MGGVYMKDEIIDNKGIELKEIPVRVNKTIKEVLEIYSKFHIPRQALLEDYLAVITTNHLEKAHNPWMYYHKGINKQNMEQGVSTLESAFIVGAMKLSKQKPTDVIRAAFYSARNDSALECGYLLNEYLLALSEQDNALIVNPSPDMILCFEEKRVGAGSNYYVVADDTIAKLYREQFPESIFFSLNEEIEQEFKSILVVNRDYSIEETVKLMRWVKCSRESVIAELPNSYLDNKKYEAAELLRRNNLQICRTVILDGNVTVTTPKKKCLVYMSKEEVKQTWELLNSEYDRKSKKLRIIDKGVRIQDNSYWDNNDSLIQSWNSAISDKKAKREPKYSTAKEYIFSEEIRLSYCIYADRKNRYAGKCWYRKLVETYPLKYAKRISPLIEKGLRASTEDGVTRKLWEVVFDDRVYPFIYSDLLELYINSNKSLSLKSIWVLIRNLLKVSSLYDEEIYIELFADTSTGISSYVNDRHSLDDLEKFLKEKLQVNKEDIPFRYFRQLNLLFEVARREKYIKYNPLAELMQSASNRASARQQDIRNVLTKKHFSDTEEEKMYKYITEPVRSDFYDAKIHKCVEQSIWLVGAIRLFTGMSLRETCALRWYDYETLDNNMGAQLSVTKFLDAQGKIITHAQKEDWTRFRCVPVARPLKLLLDQRKQYLLDMNVDARMLEQSPIVLATEDIKRLKKGEKNMFCKPIKAQEYCKKILSQANISEQWLILPDAEGERHTDIYKYHGDIFVSNLKMRLNHNCKMTMGEICYILGAVGNDTFSRHYCDYSNELVLYSMIEKMNRWTSKYEAGMCKIKETQPAKKNVEIDRQKIRSSSLSSHCASSQITLKNEGVIASTIQISVDCKHGYEIENVKYGGD